MKKSNEQGKSKGVILFAFNSGSTDYVKIAERTASLMRRNLRLPITLVTDSAVESTNFDDVKIIKNMTIEEQLAANLAEIGPDGKPKQLSLYKQKKILMS